MSGLMIDTMALAKKIAQWPAPIRIKADLDEALAPLLKDRHDEIAATINERQAVIDFIHAIANDIGTDSRSSKELFAVAKSIEAGFHRVMR